MRTPRWPLTAIIVLALTLTACGGDSEQAAPDAATSPAPTVSQTPAAPATGSATPSAAVPQGEVPDPCTALTKQEATEAVGHDITMAKTSEAMGSKLCAYTPAKATKGPTITTQTGPLVGELDNTSRYVSGQFDDVKITEIDVPGAEGARLITGKLAKSNAVVVVLEKDQMFYQILVADSGIKIKELTKMAKKGAEAMAA